MATRQRGEPASNGERRKQQQQRSGSTDQKSQTKQWTTVFISLLVGCLAGFNLGVSTSTSHFSWHKEVIFPDKPQQLLRTNHTAEIKAKGVRQMYRQSQQDILGMLTEVNATKKVVVGGIIKDGGSIKTEPLTLLVQMTCLYKVNAHVLVAQNANLLTDLYQLLAAELYPSETQCALFHAENQPTSIKKFGGRVQFLSQIREYHREQLGRLLPNVTDTSLASSTKDDAVVVLMDLDLLEVPPGEKIMKHALDMLQSQNLQHNITTDVLCAAGVIRNINNGKYGYYDTFATILLPDTFVYQEKDRHSPKIRPEEDKSLIIDSLRADGTQVNDHDLLNWMKQQSRSSDGQKMLPLPVKSCFGGMALYRASKYLDQRCSYLKVDQEVRNKYGPRSDGGNPCEHVIMNVCLHDKLGAKIAIQPDLRNKWIWNSAKHNPVNDNLVREKYSHVLSTR